MGPVRGDLVLYQHENHVKCPPIGWHSVGAAAESAACINTTSATGSSGPTVQCVWKSIRVCGSEPSACPSSAGCWSSSGSVQRTGCSESGTLCPSTAGTACTSAGYSTAVSTNTCSAATVKSHILETTSGSTSRSTI